MLPVPLRGRCLSLVSLALLAVLSACAGTASTPPPTGSLDTQVGPDYKGVVLVRDNRDGPALVKAWGQASFETPVPLAPGSRFLIGSVSKWITAVTVLRLVEQGKLDLDKPVTTWLPGLPAASAAVSLRTLLSNTSGIENGLGLAMKRDRSPERMTISATEAALRFGSGPLSFAPGTRFDYSVTNRLTPASRRELMTVQHAPEDYALGGRVRQAGSGAGARTLAWEAGASGGYKTLLVYAPADGRAVILLNNTDMAQSGQARIGLALLDALGR